MSRPNKPDLVSAVGKPHRHNLAADHTDTKKPLLLSAMLGIMEYLSARVDEHEARLGEVDPMFSDILCFFVSIPNKASSNDIH